MKSRLFRFEEKQLCSLRKLVVVGDVHGDCNTLPSVLKIADPAKDGMIFLGDYADRGECGVEVIDNVRSLRNSHPKNVLLLKGNHEDYTESGKPRFHPCTLIDEAVGKKGNWQSYFVNEFKPFANSLCLAAIIPDEMLFVHGGVSSRITSLNDLRHPQREIEEDVLWSDPVEGSGEYPNSRGAGVEFGADVTAKVCELLGVKRIVRSHEPARALAGPVFSHDGKVVTISSTSVYGGNPFVLIIDPNDPSEISHCFL